MPTLETGWVLYKSGHRVGVRCRISMRSKDQIRRRMETRRSKTPKSVHAVLAPIGVAQFKNQPPSEIEMEVKYIKSQNLRNRTKVVGTTPFEFDKDGLCKLEIKPGRGAIVYDMQSLLKQNGFTLQDVEAPPLPLPLPLPSLQRLQSPQSLNPPQSQNQSLFLSLRLSLKNLRKTPLMRKTPPTNQNVADAQRRKRMTNGSWI